MINDTRFSHSMIKWKIDTRGANNTNGSLQAIELIRYEEGTNNVQDTNKMGITDVIVANCNGIMENTIHNEHLGFMVRVIDRIIGFLDNLGLSWGNINKRIEMTTTALDSERSALVQDK